MNQATYPKFKISILEKINIFLILNKAILRLLNYKSLNFRIISIFLVIVIFYLSKKKFYINKNKKRKIYFLMLIKKF